MKKIVLGALLAAQCLWCNAQEVEIVKLLSPDLNKGLPVMKALSLRASVREFSTKELSLQELSDLLWAANGINRPEQAKRTAPSWRNVQDVDIYVVMKNSTYLYDFKEHSLQLVAKGDYRNLVAGKQKSVESAPVCLVLVSDISKFNSSDVNSTLISAGMDAGIVAENISLYCAGVGLSTVVRGSIDSKIRDVLKLTDSQHIMLNTPVGYSK